MNEEGGNDLLLLLHGGADAGHKDVVAVGDGLLDAGLAEEGQHAPVDEVGAVALRSVFEGKVGPAAEHLLAGSGLLTGAAVAGLHGEDGRADAGAGEIPAAAEGVEERFVALLERSEGFAHGLKDGSVSRVGFALLLEGEHVFGPAHVLRILPGEGEFGQLQGVGAQGGSFTGGNELVGGGHGVGDDAGDPEKQILGKGGHGRPVGDVGTVLEFHGGIGPAPALVAALFVDIGVEMVGEIGVDLIPVKIRSRGEASGVGRGSGDGAGVHEGHARDLAVAGLGALAVREVAGGVADGQGAMGRGVARAEAGAAESVLDEGAGFHELHIGAVAHEGDSLGLGSGVNGEGEGRVANALSVKDGGGEGQVLE